MSRSQRIHIHGGTYYVIQRGGRDQLVFRCPYDYELFQARLWACVRSAGARVHGYCWTPRAIHLIIQVGEVPLSRLMQTLTSTYARAARRCSGAPGRLFQERYRAALINPARYLPRLVRYLHHVPVLEGLASTPATADHTSHKAYLEAAGPPGWLSTSATRKAFQSFQSAHDAEGFAAFLQDAPTREEVALFEHVAANRRHIIADAEFLQRLPRPHRQYRSPASLDSIIDTVTCRLGVDRNAVLSDTRRREAALARAVIAWYADQRGVARVGEVARYFGRDPSTLSVAIQRHRQRHPELFNLLTMHDLTPLVPLSAVNHLCASSARRPSEECQ